MSRAAALLTAASVVAGCATRELPARDPVWADVEPVLSEACGPCHGDAAGWAVDRYPSAVGCPDGAGSAVEPPDERAPILAALGRDDHRGLLLPPERALVEAWVRAGAPARRGAAHPGGWVDPRSPSFHGVALREEGWRRMLDPSAPGACAGCHEGAGDAGVEHAAPGATPCASCHTDADGPRACGTCHGAPGRDHPPRDPCFHPDDRGGAHAAHAAAGLGCETCHGERTVEGLGTTRHGDGLVQVALDRAIAGATARWDPGRRTCVGSCHDRGGARTSVTWEDELELGCGDCHGAPPAGHPAGGCDGCHAEATPDGTALLDGPLHLDGRVDLGDGTEGCGACHGEADDPWPSTGAHAAHRAPRDASPVPCASCHAVPETVDAPGHFDDTVGAEVRLRGGALARGATPRWEAPTCAGVACHGAGLSGGALPAPSWSTGADARRCGACHGLPPLPPHPTATGCGASACHGGYAGPGPTVTDTGRAVHVDGTVDLWGAR